MTIEEYLLKCEANEPVTFILSKTVKSEGDSFYHDEFEMMSAMTAAEWLGLERISMFIVINKDHPPIDITGFTTEQYKQGKLKCAIIIDADELKKQCGEKGKSMIQWYEENIK